MKKIISLVIAAMMAVSMFAVTVPAMAANVSSLQQLLFKRAKLKLQ